MKTPQRLNIPRGRVVPAAGLKNPRSREIGNRNQEVDVALTLCNGYSSEISTAIMFYSPNTCGGEGENFEMRGWWNIEPGSCALVDTDDLKDVNRYWFYFAHSSDGAVWSGPYGAAVPTEAFDQCYGIGVSPGEEINFRLLDIGSFDNYTLTFIS
jgi:Protein of unknown function (DUF1036)